MAFAASQQALAAKVNFAGKQLNIKKNAKTARVPRAAIRAAASTATVSDAVGKRRKRKKNQSVALFLCVEGDEKRQMD